MKPLVINAHMDAASFRKFYLFDVLTRGRAWARPVAFASLMTGLAVLCYVFSYLQRGAAFLGTVLLVIGLGLPAVFFLSVFQFVRRSVKALGLTGGQSKVSAKVTLSDEGVLVEGGKTPSRHPWDTVDSAYRREDAVYLYVTPRQGLLLPDADAGGRDKLWSVLTGHLPASKLH